MTKLVLSLLASDLDKTIAFYRQFGFCQSGGDSATGWVEVARDGAAIQFYDEAPVDTPASPMLSGTIVLQVDEIESIVAGLGDSVPFAWGPEEMEYGTHEFAVRDPNGYLVVFSAPAKIGT